MPPHTPVRTFSSLWPLLVLLVLSCCSHVVSGATYPAFTLVPTMTPFVGRNDAFTFEWHGRQWVAGGYSNGGFRSDVWSSYDLGRNWTLTSYLPTPCYAGQVNAAVHAQSVYLKCSNTALTFVSRDPQLATASWSYVSSTVGSTSDGLTGRNDFNMQRMAVPFDGVGTLILTNGIDGNDVPVNDVWWLSATGNFQPGVANAGTQWHQYTVGGAVYHAPWPARSLANTVVDAEGLVLIMTSGQLQDQYQTFNGNGVPTFHSPVYTSDVWQLSWLNGQTAPSVYQLTAAAGWTPRVQATMWRVHDSLFFYAGNNANYNKQDDLYQSMDYGSTWYLMTSSATGTPRNQASPLVVGRRFFIVGGENIQYTRLSSVWVAYW